MDSNSLIIIFVLIVLVVFVLYEIFNPSINQIIISISKDKDVSFFKRKRRSRRGDRNNKSEDG